METWITLLRKFRQWEWYQNSNMVHLFIHLLLSANHADNNWQGKIIKRGQLAVGRKKLSADTGISEQKIRTCFNKLKLTNEIIIKSTSKYSIITICKYDTYQSKDSKTNQRINHQLTSNQPATNHQLTTNNNENNVNNDKNDKEVYMGIDISFDNFYNTYDKKVGYKKCHAKWNNATLSKEKKKLAIDYLPTYKQVQPDKKFRQNPLTYINSETWNDEIIKEETQEDRNTKIRKNLKVKWEKEDTEKQLTKTQ